MDEVNHIRVSVAVHSIAAVIMGWASVYIAGASRALYAGIAGIVVMIVIGFAVQKALGNKGRKWWLANGVAMFLMVWLVSWLVFYNISISGI
jgi:hypothetical protein